MFQEYKIQQRACHPSGELPRHPVTYTMFCIQIEDQAPLDEIYEWSPNGRQWPDPKAEHPDISPVKDHQGTMPHYD